MPFQPVPSVASCELIVRGVALGDFRGAHALNFKWTTAGDPIYTDLEDLIEGTVVPWFTDHYAPIMSSGVQLAEVHCRGQWAEASPYYVTTPNVAGTQTGDVMTAKATLAVRFTTGYTGRSRRGRAFMLGLAESQASGNVVTNAYADAVIDCWGALQSDLSSTPWEHCVVSRTVDGVRLAIADSYVITGYSLADKTIDIQKDRAT